MDISLKKDEVCPYCNTTQSQERIFCEKCNKALKNSKVPLFEKIGREIIMSAARMIGAVKEESNQQKNSKEPAEHLTLLIVKVPGVIALCALLYSLVHLLQNPAKPILNPDFYVFSNMGTEAAVVSFAGAVYFFLLRNNSLLRMIFSISIGILIIMRPLIHLVKYPDDLASFVNIYLNRDNIEALVWGGGFMLVSIYVNKRIF